MRPQRYELTFTGQAAPALSAEFDDYAVTVGPVTTTLRADLPDQAALLGLLKRLTDLGLELDHLRLVPLGQAGSPTAG